MKCGKPLVNKIMLCRYDLLARHSAGESLYVPQLLRHPLRNVLHAVIYWWLQQPGREMRQLSMRKHIWRAL